MLMMVYTISLLYNIYEVVWKLSEFKYLESVITKMWFTVEVKEWYQEMLII